jgi:hypothetical protein
VQPEVLGGVGAEGGEQSPATNCSVVASVTDPVAARCAEVGKS